MFFKTISVYSVYFRLLVTAVLIESQLWVTVFSTSTTSSYEHVLVKIILNINNYCHVFNNINKSTENVSKWQRNDVLNISLLSFYAHLLIPLN